MISRETALNSARLTAEWYVRNVNWDVNTSAAAGSFPFQTSFNIRPVTAYSAQWNLGFGIMGMLSAGKVFDEERYFDTAAQMMNYVKTLQIFEPFLPEDYGAFRELTPQTTWCYVRDALSAAWGCLAYYEATGKEEYLERARLWAEWFLRRGMDETGWPVWGRLFDSKKGHRQPEMYMDMHGCFHGGCLNFFYHLARLSGDKKWVGGFFEHIADYFAGVIQQKDGFFRTVRKETRMVPDADPQSGLHRGNDDLGTLGLLCAWKALGKESYLRSIEKFLAGAFSRQQEDGHFEKSCAAIPVILNVLHEGNGIIDFTPDEIACQKAADALIARQFTHADPLFNGAFNEGGDGDMCMRSSTYAMIYLLKHYGGDNRFLAID